MAFWVLAVWIGGCSIPPLGPVEDGPTQTEREGEALQRLGEQRLAQGRVCEAGDAFRASLRLAKKPGQRARAYLGLARVEMALDQKALALDWLQRLLGDTPPPRYLVQGELLSARLEKELKQYRRAADRLRRLLHLPDYPLSRQDRQVAVKWLSEIMSAQGRSSASVSAVLKLVREVGPPYDAEAAGHVADAAAKAPSQQLAALLNQAVEPELKAGLQYGLARVYLREGNIELAQETLARLRSWPQAYLLTGRLRALQEELGQAATVNPRAVGVILPLSGRHAEFGSQVLAAVELGLGLFSGTAHQPVLYIEDSRSEPVAAAEAVSRLVQSRRVIAIIGPMGSSASLAAARRAQVLGVPLISLTQVEEVTLAGEFVFQNFVTPREQAAAVLEEAMEQREARRVAVLAPDNSYGRGFAKLAAKQVALRSGELVRTVFYKTGQTDFTPWIKELVHLPPGKYRPGHPDSPQARIDFQALFLPDGPTRAAMVIPQLTYFDVTGVYLLGTSLWHNPKLLQVGSRYLKGSIIPVSFDPKSPNPRVREFVSEFKKALGREPNLFDAHAYDAARLVRQLINSAIPPRTRRALRDALQDLHGVAGVCGPLSVGSDRRVAKRLNLFTVDRGAFRDLRSLKLQPQPLERSNGKGSSQPAGSEARHWVSRGKSMSPARREAPAAAVLR